MISRMSVLIFLFLTSQALAGPRVELVQPTFSGSGCPKGTADIFISNNAKRIDVIFDSFFVEAGKAFGHAAAKKECDLSVRVKIPHGFSLAVARVEYNGVNRLPFGSSAHLLGAHFLNYDQLAVVNKRFYGHSNSAFDINSKVGDHELTWTSCGEEVLISSRTSIEVAALKSVNPASVQVDDKSMRPGISYYLKWRSCSEQGLK